MSDTRGLASLKVWQKSIELAEKIHKEFIPALPEEEKWALSSQIRRSSQSIGANIAEGYGRYYYQEGVRFSYIARGSLEETFSHLHFARTMGYLTEEDFNNYADLINEIRRMIAGYITYLKKNKIGKDEPGSGIYETPAQYTLEPDEKEETQ